MKNSRPPLTLAQLAVEDILTKAIELPVGRSLIQLDRAGDGTGGIVVTRFSPDILIFQRIGGVRK